MSSKTAQKLSKNCSESDSSTSKINPRARFFPTSTTLNFRVSIFSRFVVFFVPHLESVLSHFQSTFLPLLDRTWPFVTKSFVRELQEETRFPHPRVSNNDVLEHVIVRHLVLRFSFFFLYFSFLEAAQLLVRILDNTRREESTRRCRGRSSSFEY